jgi:aspartate carbamoyltransferase catalytic subunit
MKLAHIVESQQFTLPMLNDLFNRADEMERVLTRGGTRDYATRIMASLFYEPSTRTRFSFESAMFRLGGHIVSTERAQEFSSASLGESLEDTIRVVANYSDVIVLRHNEVGGASRASRVSAVPIINAGDGKGGQHPTQALLDLYTIHKEVKTIDGVNIAFVGNLIDGRTVRSLAYLLGKFERVRIFFVAPSPLQMKQDILDYLNRHKVWFSLESDLARVLPEVDVVYMTRIEAERLPVGSPSVPYYIDPTIMKSMKPTAILLHPLPRLSEISPDIDADPRAAYFRQTRNGIVMRMALLSSVLD